MSGKKRCLDQMEGKVLQLSCYYFTMNENILTEISHSEKKKISQNISRSCGNTLAV
jgi:hypothetical protein